MTPYAWNRAGLSMPPSIPIALILMLSTLLCGCYVHVSEAYLESSANTGWHSQSKGGYSFLHGPDISIYVRSSNTDPSIGPLFREKEHPKYFGISLWFDPKVNNFELNPDDTLLILPDSEKIKPAKTRVAHTGMRVDAAGWECGRSRADDIGAGPSYALFQGVCVELYYAVNTPTPEMSFSMYLGGLKRDKKMILVPEVHFREGSFWVLD
jgi:hypothetical protein